MSHVVPDYFTETASSLPKVFQTSFFRQLSFPLRDPHCLAKDMLQSNKSRTNRGRYYHEKEFSKSHRNFLIFHISGFWCCYAVARAVLGSRGTGRRRGSAL